MSKENGMSGQYLVAERRGQAWALPLADVRGGLPRTGLEPVPRGEPGWLGVLAVRGEVVVAVSIDPWLDVTDSDAGSDPEALVLFRVQGTTVALAFDRLRGVVSLDHDALKPHPAAAERPWLSAVFADERYARLEVVDGAALGAALVGRVIEEAIA